MNLWGADSTGLCPTAPRFYEPQIYGAAISGSPVYGAAIYGARIYDSAIYGARIYGAQTLQGSAPQLPGSMSHKPMGQRFLVQ